MWMLAPSQVIYFFPSYLSFFCISWKSEHFKVFTSLIVAPICREGRHCILYINNETRIVGVISAGDSYHSSCASSSESPYVVLSPQTRSLFFLTLPSSHCLNCFNCFFLLSIPSISLSSPFPFYIYIFFLSEYFSFHFH